MKKKSAIKLLLIIIIVIALGFVIYSSYNIIKWQNENKNIKALTKLTNETNIYDVLDNSNTEFPNKDNINRNDPYWDYIKIPLMSVNFDKLLNINTDTIGWLKVEGTNINYPVVQANSNNYYLNHAYDNSYNNAGWVFMDYRNNSINFGYNTIIYGHARYDKSMFGTLRNITKDNWYKNTQNHILKFSTPTENTLWQIVSVYTIKSESYYLTTEFGRDEDYNKWLNTILKRSIFNFKTALDSNDKIMTLSSCYTSVDNVRVVLHAKLIKRERR